MIIRNFFFFLALVIVWSVALGNSVDQNEIVDKPIDREGVFVENKGQWDKEVRFLTKTGGMKAWITDRGIVFDFYRMERGGNLFKRSEREYRDGMLIEPEKARYYGHVVKMSFSSSSEANPVFRSHEQKATYYNYFLGNDPSRWASNVPLYSEVIAKELYPGIDVRYYYEAEGLRYDFIIQPGAQVEEIAITFEGADDVWVDENGELVMLTILGEVRHAGLKAFQEIEGERIAVPGRFHLRGDDGVGLEVERKEDTEPLIIDPLISSTFLGGTDEDVGWSLALDSEDIVYVTGWTRSANFPTTPGAYDETHNGSVDVFVSSLSSDLSELLYSTFLSGSDSEWGYSLALDSEGTVYVIGSTNSADFPITLGAYDEAYNGGMRDVFISALSPDLSELVFSTFLGGNGWDIGHSIAIDSEGTVYVTGWTGAANFPTTQEAYDQTHNGSHDVFVSAFSSDLSELVHSTFVGGSMAEECFSLALDSEGIVYVTGHTRSSNFPITPGAYDETHNGGMWDGFVSALSSDLSELLYSTFLGGNGQDLGHNLHLNSEGTVYVTGNTGSSNFPTTPGAFDETHNFGRDIFVSALSPDLSVLVYSTFLGGTGNDWGRSLALDSEGTVYVTGYTGSSNFPTTPEAYDETHNGGWDVIVTALSPDLSELVYSTFLGGSEGDWGQSITLNSEGTVYVTGETESDDFPTTPGAYDETHNSEADVIIFTIPIEVHPLPNQVVLAYPENSKTIDLDEEDIKVQIGWYKKAPTVTRYHLEIADDSVFTNIVYDNNEITDTSHVWDGVEENVVFWWRVSARNATGWGPTSDAWAFSAVLVGIDGSTVLPAKYALYQNYPNPFNPATTIRFELPEADEVQLTVYDILGREIETLVDGYKDAGYYEAVFDAGQLSSGVYLYQLRAGEFVETKRFMLVK